MFTDVNSLITRVITKVNPRPCIAHPRLLENFPEQPPRGRRRGVETRSEGDKEGSLERAREGGDATPAGKRKQAKQGRLREGNGAASLKGKRPRGGRGCTATLCP